MEKHFKEKGVFLSSKNLDSTLLLKCLQALLSHYPTLRFTSITTDDKLGGFKVLFSGPEVTAVLEKKQLRIDGEVIGIYPLTTVLTIYDIGAFENPLLEDDVLEAVSEKYGKVFDVIKFDSEVVLDALSKKLENSFDASKIEPLEKKWRVRIDLPEFEGLEIYQLEIEKFIVLPKWDKNLKVSFWCRCCKVSGHFQHSCPKKLQPVVAVRSENVLNGQSNYVEENKTLKSPNIHVQSVSSLGSEVPSDSCDDQLSPETTENFVETTERVPKARKTFRSSEDDNQNYKRIKTSESASNVKNDQNKHLKISLKNIKKEIVEEDDDDTSYRKASQNMECEQSDNTDNENQSDTEPDVRRFMSYEEETKLCIDTASNDASDFAGKATSEGKSDENSNSTFADEKEKINPSRTSTPSGPSHIVTPTSSSILGAADTSILSDELQGYINHACETIGALDRQTLDAFLGYVKKKNKPTQIALKYTPNVKQLKDQLQMILTLRYHTKPTNQVKEDAVFIKWLEGLVSRFDNTKPSKRKKPGYD